MPSHILIGPMGVGKSTVGAELAKALNTPFIDTDRVIEERSGKSVSDIFIEDGETAFRAKEEDVLIETLKNDGVLALGGGACVSERAQDALRKSGAQIIFLDISLAEVSKRVGFDQARPLLALNPRTKWQELMEKRRSIYESLASKHILVDGKSVSDIVSEIGGV